MSDQQSISVLPQTGHGRFAVRDALFIEEAKLFISLDEAGALILWDYSTSQQLAALSFPAGKPKPGKLRYEEETLYAFGSLAIYRWALEELRACKQKTGTQPAQPWIDFTLEERFANIEDRLVDGNLSAGRRFYSFRVNSFQSSFSIDQDFYLYNLEMGQAAPSGGLAMHFKNDELLAIANSDLSSFTIVIQGHSYHEQTQLLALVLDLGEIDVGWGGHVVKLTTRERRVLLLDPAKDLSNGVKKNEIMADVSFFQSIGHLIWRFNLEDNCLFWQENSAGFPLMKMSLDVQAAPESIALPQPAKSFRAGPIIDEEQYGIFNGNKGLEIHNLSQNKEVASFPGERHLLHFEANGQLIASAGPAQPLNLWNWKTQTLRRSFFADIPKVKSCYGLEDGGIRFVFNNNSIYTLRIEEGFQLSHQLDWDQPMGHAVFSPDGRYAAIVNAHAPHELFLLEGEKQIRKIPAAEASELLYAEQITFSPDSQWMAYLLQDEKKNCTLLDIYQLEDIISQEEMNFNLFLRQQSSKKSIRINLNSTKEPALHEGLPPRSHHLAFHPTSPLLAVCFEDEEARNNLLLYDCQQVASGTPFTAVGEKVTLADNGEEPLQIHFDKSGQFLTFRGMGRAEILEVLDIETGTFRPLFSPTAPSNPQKVRKGWLNEFAPSANTPLLFNFNGEQHIALEQAEKKLLFGKLSGLIEYFETAPANRRPLEEEASFLQLDVSNAPYDGLCIMENLPLVFFTSLDQEAIYLANWKTRQVAGKLYLSGENKFLLFDEDSYSYYTTAESLGMIAFQQGEELFPMDQFDLILNRPHRLLDKMGVFPAPSLLVGKFEQAFNRRLEKAFEGHDDSLREKILTRINTKVLEEIDNRGVAALPDVFEALNLPSITYQLPDSQNGVTDQAELSFKFAVSGNGEKLARMNIHVNGVPANGEMDIVEMLQVSKKTFGGRQGIIPAFSMQGHFTSTIHLQLSKGMNEVQLSALNQIGGEALRKTFYIRYENKQSPPVKPRLYFIGIGVGEHELGPRLNFPKPDIEKLAA
ncbi:MAG: WD40 repeat domain-containing protein, partial [Phaeodactylibacter sp.]|nr:WD40 repeat domain-containing protein [Phaeodactylibacter sp.]